MCLLACPMHVLQLNQEYRRTRVLYAFHFEIRSMSVTKCLQMVLNLLTVLSLKSFDYFWYFIDKPLYSSFTCTMSSIGNDHCTLLYFIHSNLLTGLHSPNTRCIFAAFILSELSTDRFDKDINLVIVNIRQQFWVFLISICFIHTTRNKKYYVSSRLCIQ